MADLIGSITGKKGSRRAAKPAEAKPAEAKAKPKADTSKPAPAPKTTATSANTRGPAYLAIFNTSEDCKKDREAIQKKCAPDTTSEADQEKAGNPVKKTGAMGKISAATKGMDKLGRTTSLYNFKHENAWMDKHCDGMWNKPQKLKDASKEFKDAATQSLEKFKDAQSGLIKEALHELGSIALEKAGAAAGKKIAGLLARSVAKNVVGGAAMIITLGTLGTALEAAMLAWTVADAISTATELAAMAGEEGAAALANALDAANMGDKVKAMIADYAQNPDKALAEAMTLQSKFNRCLQAKRCQLVSMSQTSAKAAAKSGNGCCPGQTGHHLLPREMFKRKIQVPTGKLYKNGKPEMESKDDPTNCNEYTDSVHNNAPVVCVEGANNRIGSHGGIHKNIDNLMYTHREHNPVDHISNNDAMDLAVLSHQQTFKPPCDKKCLKAQLKEYYDKLCQNKLKPRGGMGSDVIIDGVDETDSNAR